MYLYRTWNDCLYKWRSINDVRKKLLLRDFLEDQLSEFCLEQKIHFW
eukprot:UN10837